MAGFHKILVPLDHGEVSDRALDIAIQMAHRFGAEIIAVSVRHEPVNLDQDAARAALDEVEREARSLEGRVRDHIRSAADIPEDRVRVEIRSGSVVGAIVDSAEENQVDLIVMGTHGRVGLADHLIGSTTERVQQRVTASVLAVRPLGFPYLRD